MLQSPVLVGLNHVLKGDPALLARAQAHAGKRIQLRITPFPPHAIAIDTSGYATGAGTLDNADLTIEGSVTPWAIFDGSKRLWSDRLTMSGDESLASLIRDALQSFDMEDELAKWIGDIPAHRIGNAARSIGTASADIAERMARNVAEYLAEERGVLVSKAHLETLVGDVAALDARLDTLSKRIEAIERITRAM